MNSYVGPYILLMRELFHEMLFVGHTFPPQKSRMSPRIQSLETKMTKTLLDEREVSIVTGVPQKTLQYWRFTGASFAPKFIKLGTLVYYRKEELEQWLEDKPSFTSTTHAKGQGAG